MFYLVWWVRLPILLGENIGVMAITGVYSVWVIRGAHFWQSFSVVGKISAISNIQLSNGRNNHVVVWRSTVQGFRMFVEQK
jgi:uracil permease